MKNFNILFIISMLANQVFGQILNGPMLGYNTYREQALWVQTEKAAKVEFVYRPVGSGSGSVWLKSSAVNTKESKAFVAEVVLDNLSPGTTYEYLVHLNGKATASIGKQQFTTQTIWAYRTDPPNYKFAIGSCSYINEEKTDRNGKPYGADYQIFKAIEASAPHFMLWLGDNVYFRESDWTTKSGMQHRYTHSRNLPELKTLLANAPQYAIWDDHDFGPNNSDRSFINKELSKETFDLFWSNPTHEHPDLQGITSQFDWSDCQFFLLDNRYNRAPNDRLDGDRTVLGTQQLEWFKEALLNSPATFKFVAIGGQFLNTAPVFENYSANGYDQERQEIIDFIYKHQIKNVIFLTGDRHHSELSVLENEGQPIIYDLTISPLTSGVHDASSEANSLRVTGSHIAVRNFALINVSGPLKARELDIQIQSSDNKPLWQTKIKAQ
jgi:alkaline phosphatase D